MGVTIMKITRPTALEFEGDDFRGEWEELKSSEGSGARITIHLNGPEVKEGALTPHAKGFKIEWPDSPSWGFFSNIHNEQELDRLCAAAKMAWRETQKHK
jgi:hypothetical protein